ncbi:MAG TPA: hypothetical protein VLX28_19835 [Thermoanaerobaculia bacterium]|nr:hypothetical protein [Thermoanaerobaculia bacterium]
MGVPRTVPLHSWAKIWAPSNIFAPPATLKLRVHVELDGPQGCIKKAEDGRDVQVVFSFAQSGGTNFYNYVAKQLDR